MGHFHFLHFIYFQIVFSVFSSSSDASTYFQMKNFSFEMSYKIKKLLLQLNK